MASVGFESLFSNATARASLVGYSTEEDKGLDAATATAASFPLETSLETETASRSTAILAIVNTQQPGPTQTPQLLPSFLPSFPLSLLEERQTLKTPKPYFPTYLAAIPTPNEFPSQPTY
jgi:hypothetical protein